MENVACQDRDESPLETCGHGREPAGKTLQRNSSRRLPKQRTGGVKALDLGRWKRWKPCQIAVMCDRHLLVGPVGGNPFRPRHIHKEIGVSEVGVEQWGAAVRQ